MSSKKNSIFTENNIANTNKKQRKSYYIFHRRNAIRFDLRLMVKVTEVILQAIFYISVEQVVGKTSDPGTFWVPST